ncbi:hypothetical protein CF319_g661 [Tilletia indica]|nr:hypothetical protein CF319_g661 [Tilletia indica]
MHLSRSSESPSASSSSRPTFRHAATSEISPGLNSTTTTRSRNTLSSPPSSSHSSRGGITAAAGGALSPPPFGYASPNMPSSAYHNLNLNLSKTSMSNLSAASRSPTASSPSMHGLSAPPTPDAAGLSPSSPFTSSSHGRPPSVRSFNSDRSGNSKTSRTSRATTATTRAVRKSNRSRILASSATGLYNNGTQDSFIDEDGNMTALQRTQSSMGRHSYRSSVSSTTTSASGRATSIGYASGSNPPMSPPVPGLPNHYRTQQGVYNSTDDSLPHRLPISSSYESSIVSSSASSISGRSRRKASQSPSRHANKPARSAITRQADSALSGASLLPSSSSSSSRISPGLSASHLGPSIVLDTEHLRSGTPSDRYYNRRSVERERITSTRRPESFGFTDGWRDDEEEHLDPHARTRVSSANSPYMMPPRPAVGRTSSVVLGSGGGGLGGGGSGLGVGSTSSFGFPSPALSAPPDLMRLHSGGSARSIGSSSIFPSAGSSVIPSAGHSPGLFSSTSSFSLRPSAPESPAAGAAVGPDGRRLLAASDAGEADTRFFTPPEEQGSFFTGGSSPSSSSNAHHQTGALASPPTATSSSRTGSNRDAQQRDREALSSGSNAFLPLPTVMERSGSADTKASRDTPHHNNHASAAANAISGLRSRLLAGFKSSGSRKKGAGSSASHGGLTSGEVTETENTSAGSSAAVTPLPSAHPSPKKHTEALPSVTGFTPLEPSGGAGAGMGAGGTTLGTPETSTSTPIPMPMTLPMRSPSLTIPDRKKSLPSPDLRVRQNAFDTGSGAGGHAMMPVLPEIARSTDTPLLGSFMNGGSGGSVGESSISSESSTPPAPPEKENANANGNANANANGNANANPNANLNANGNAIIGENGLKTLMLTPNMRLSPSRAPDAAASPGASMSDETLPATPSKAQPALPDSSAEDSKLSKPPGRDASPGASPNGRLHRPPQNIEVIPYSALPSNVKLSPASPSTPTSPRSPTLRGNKLRPAQMPMPTLPLPPPPSAPSSAASEGSVDLSGSSTPGAAAAADGMRSGAGGGGPPVVPPRMRPVRNPLRGSGVPGQGGVPPLPTSTAGRGPSPSAPTNGKLERKVSMPDGLSTDASKKDGPAPPQSGLSPRPMSADDADRTRPTSSTYTTPLLSSVSELSISSDGGASASSVSMKQGAKRAAVSVATEEAQLGQNAAGRASRDEVSSTARARSTPESVDVPQRAAAPSSSSAWMTGEGVLGEHLLEGAFDAKKQQQQQQQQQQTDAGAAVGDTSFSSSTNEHAPSALGTNLRAHASTTSLGTMKKGRLGLGTAFRQKKDQDRDAAGANGDRSHKVGDTDDEGGPSSNWQGSIGESTLGGKKKGRRWRFGAKDSSNEGGGGGATMSDFEDFDFLGRPRRKSKTETPISRASIRRIFDEGDPAAPVNGDSAAGAARASPDHDTVDALPIVGSVGPRSGAGLNGRHNSISGPQIVPAQTLPGHRPSLPSLRKQPSYESYSSHYGPDSHSPSAYVAPPSSTSGVGSEDVQQNQRWPSMSTGAGTTRSSVQEGSASDHGFSLPGSFSMHTTTGAASLPPLATAETKRLYKRANVIRELIETERRYAADLRVIRDVILIPARMAAGMPNTPVTPFSGGMPGSSGFLGGPGGYSSSVLTPPSFGGMQRGNSITSLPTFAPSAISRKASVDSTNLQGGLRGSSSSMSAQMMGAQVGINGQQGSPAASASIAPTSTDASNRSSTYTVSSQSSMTSQSTAPPVPPLPAGSTSGAPSVAGGDDSQRSSVLMSPVVKSSPAPPPLTLNLTQQTSSPATTMQSFSMQTPPLLQGVAPSPSAMSSTSLNVPGSTSDAPLTAVEIRVIFANLEHCCAFAEEMVAQFDAAAEEQAAVVGGAQTGNSSPALSSSAALMLDVGPDTIARIFSKMMPRMEQIYAHYCSKHEPSMLRLAEVLRANGKGATFIRNRIEIAMTQSNAWDLGSFLIKPVQRVLKYPLLLRQILDATHPSQPEFGVIQEAHNEMMRIADHLNEVKKRRDIVDEVLGYANAPGKSGRSASVSGGTGNTISAKKMKKKGEKEKERLQRSNASGPGGGPSISLMIPIFEESYRSLANEFHKLETIIHDLPARCLGWCDHLKESYEAEARLLDQWRTVYVAQHNPMLNPGEVGPDFAPQSIQAAESPLDPETENRVNAYIAILIETLSPTGSCQRMYDVVRGSIIPQAGKLLQLVINPRQVMAKRDGLQPEYAKYRFKVKVATDAAGASLPRDKDGLNPDSEHAAALTPGPQTQSAHSAATISSALAKVNSDSKLVEAAEAFVALHTQLLEDLPQLIYGLQLSLNILMRSFAALQERHYEDRQLALMRYWARWAWNRSDMLPISVSPPEVPAKTTVNARIDPELNVVKAYWARQRANPSVLCILEGRRLIAMSEGKRVESREAGSGTVSGEGSTATSEAAHGGEQKTTSFSTGRTD